MGTLSKFLVTAFDSGVVVYDRRTFIRLATRYVMSIVDPPCLHKDETWERDS